MASSKKIRYSKKLFDEKQEKIQKMYDEKQTEVKKKRDFITKLKKTIQIELTKVSELEGAILALYELLTGEKVK